MKITAAMTEEQYHMRAIIAMQNSLQGNGYYQGLLGNMNGDPLDDLRPNGGGSVLDPTTVTADNLFVFGNTCTFSPY